MSRRLRLTLALISLAGSAACTSSATPTPVSAQASAYPSAAASPSFGYPPPNLESGEIPPTFIPQAPVDAPQPASGQASISGALYSPQSSSVIRDTAFYLAQGIGESNRELPPVLGDPVLQRGDIVGKTDANAQFALNSIPPGNYFLLVWAPYGWRPAEVGPDNHEPLLIELQPDQRLALGLVYLSWP